MSESRETTTPSVADLLLGIDLFDGLAEDDVRRVAEVARRLEVEADATLFEGDSPGLFVVRSGAVEIEGRRGRDIRSRGEAFGVASLIFVDAGPSGGRALEPTELVLVPRDAFRALLGADPLVGRVLEHLEEAVGRDAGASPGRRRREEGADERAGEAPGGRPLSREPQAPGHPGPPLQARMAEVSRLVQRGLLPRDAPRVPGWDVAAGTTAEESGRGDTAWDWLRLAPDRVVLVALDVQGQGLPPSHHLMAARVLLRALAGEHGEPKDILARANAALSRARVGGGEQFLECGMVVLRETEVEWAAAGRVPAAVLRRGGEVEELGSHGPPLGVMEGFRYASHKVPMAAGDVFVVLSQASMGMFRGAAELVAKIQQRPAGEVVETLHLALRRAYGDDPPRETSVLFARKH